MLYCFIKYIIKLSISIYIKMEPKMYNNSSIENGWAYLADFLFVVFVITWTRFLLKKILGKYSGKVDIWM